MVHGFVRDYGTPCQAPSTNAMRAAIGTEHARGKAHATARAALGSERHAAGYNVPRAHCAPLGAQAARSEFRTKG